MFVVLLPGTARGQSEDYRNYMKVPIVTGEGLHRVRSILREGNTQIRRIALFGDSQETSPGGAGNAYIPRLQRNLQERFGYIGETPFFGTSPQGSGSPPAGWLMVINIAQDGPLDSAITSDRVPPGLNVKGNVLPSEGGPQQNGGYFCLVHDGILTGDPISLPHNRMNPAHQIAAEILVFDTGNGAGAKYNLRPTDIPTEWSAPVGSEEFTLEPISGSPGVLLGRSSSLYRGTKKYHRIEILGTDPVDPIEIAGVRFVDMEQQNGILVQAFSSGGYTAASFLAHHAKSAGILRAINPHVAILQYGANDMNSWGPLAFEQDVRSLVAFIRETMDDPCFPIVLFGEPWRWLPMAIQHRQDQYPAVLENIANSESGIVAINMRRLLEERYGWNEDYDPHLTDLVHLTPIAQVAVANVVAELLLPAVGASCDGDFNNDGLVNGFDLGDFLLHFDAQGSQPKECPTSYDLNGDGLVNNADLGLFLTCVGPCPREFDAQSTGLGRAD